MTKEQQRTLMERAEIAAGGMTPLAEAIGVRPSTVYRWMNGTRRMNGMAIRAVQGFVSVKKGGK